MELFHGIGDVLQLSRSEGGNKRFPTYLVKTIAAIGEIIRKANSPESSARDHAKPVQESFRHAEAAICHRASGFRQARDTDPPARPVH